MAVPDFKGDSRYYIVCQQFPDGCVTDGSNSGQQTPVGYITQRTADDANLWTITGTDNGLYYIQNAKTGKYVTYDGVREGTTRRYVNMTAEPDGDRSLWTVTVQSGKYFTIRNVAKTDQLWDVRVSSYVVGTYSNTGSGAQNQLFAFYDETGTAVEDVHIRQEPLAKAIEGLRIGQYAPLYTTDQGGCYLYPTPSEHFGQDVTLPVRYTANEGWGRMHIDGTEVRDGDTYTFSKVTGGKYHTLTISHSDGTTVTTRMTFTSLPVVSIDGTFSDNYSEGGIIVQEPGKEQYERQRMKAKWRGGITNGSDKHKRNYHVKFMDADGEKKDQKFFGLRNDNSWILEACQVDMSRIRNRMVTDLWNDYCTKPYYADREPKALSGTRGRFVELILNEEYRGIYCMTEAMDRKQMKLAKYDEDTQTIHGELWKSKDWSYSVFMGHQSDNTTYPGTSPVVFNNNSESWDRYYVKYPDIEDVKPTDWQTLYDAVDFVCTSSDSLFRLQVAEYFDMPVVIDYYILMETTLATDNHGKNMYFAVYDKQTDKRITFGLWDMDACLGQRWSDYYYHSTLMQPEQDYAAYITKNEHGDHNLFRRLRNTNAGDFNMQVRMRYRDLRQTWLQTDSIIARFERQTAAFATAGADKREYKKWSGDSDVAGKTLNFSTELTYLKNWITKRMNYLDKTRFDIDALQAGIHTVEAGHTTTPRKGMPGIFTLDGRRVSSTSDEQELRQLPPGIYIVNGRKIAVGR
jgi:hypothetical protein